MLARVRVVLRPADYSQRCVAYSLFIAGKSKFGEEKGDKGSLMTGRKYVADLDNCQCFASLGRWLAKVSKSAR
jgi:hypothetical protein